MRGCEDCGERDIGGRKGDREEEKGARLHRTKF